MQMAHLCINWRILALAFIISLFPVHTHMHTCTETSSHSRPIMPFCVLSASPLHRSAMHSRKANLHTSTGLHEKKEHILLYSYCARDAVKYVLLSNIQ